MGVGGLATSLVKAGPHAVMLAPPRAGEWPMVDADKLTIFALATKNDELQRQLAQAQDRLVETAIEAGHLHARIEALEAQLAQAERDAGKAQASRVIETGFSVASLRPAPRVHETRKSA